MYRCQPASLIDDPASLSFFSFLFWATARHSFLLTFFLSSLFACLFARWPRRSGLSLLPRAHIRSAHIVCTTHPSGPLAALIYQIRPETGWLVTVDPVPVQQRPVRLYSSNGKFASRLKKSPMHLLVSRRLGYEVLVLVGQSQGLERIRNIWPIVCAYLPANGIVPSITGLCLGVHTAPGLIG